MKPAKIFKRLTRHSCICLTRSSSSLNEVDNLLLTPFLPRYVVFSGRFRPPSLLTPKHSRGSKHLPITYPSPHQPCFIVSFDNSNFQSSLKFADGCAVLRMSIRFKSVDRVWHLHCFAPATFSHIILQVLYNRYTYIHRPPFISNSHVACHHFALCHHFASSGLARSRSASSISGVVCGFSGDA